MFKRTLQVLVGVALVVQLAGCFYWGDDHRWHDGHRDYHDHGDHDSGIDVHVHG